MHKICSCKFRVVFFWYGFLNNKKLRKIYPEYVPKEKVKEIEKKRKQDSTITLQNQVSDFLFSIVRDHPEIIGEGLAEIHLAALAPRLKHTAVAEDARSLKRFASRLERIDAFSRKNLKKKTGRVVEEIEYSFETIDFITQKEVAKYADEYFWDDECGYIELAHRRMGYEMQIRIRYKGDQTLQKVVERIDETILPIKPYLEMIYRFGKSRWPF